MPWGFANKGFMPEEGGRQYTHVHTCTHAHSSLLCVALWGSHKAPQTTRDQSVHRQSLVGCLLIPSPGLETPDTLGHHEDLLPAGSLSGYTYLVPENSENRWAHLPPGLLGHFSACLKPEQERGPDESHSASSSSSRNLKFVQRFKYFQAHSLSSLRTNS